MVEILTCPRCNQDIKPADERDFSDPPKHALCNQHGECYTTCLTKHNPLDWIHEDLHDRVTPHLEHPWLQLGRCVYCARCETRLYNGRIPPPQQRVYRFEKERQKKASDSDRMRERWNKP